MPTQGRAGRQHGFTLVELMVTITVMGVVLAIGVPSFRDFIASQRVKTVVSEFNSALFIARSEAIKRNAPVVITSAGSGWQGGWTIKAGAIDLVTQQTIPDLAVTLVATHDNSAVTTITFAGNGRLLPAPVEKLKFQASGTSSSKCLHVDQTGVPGAVAC